MLKVEYLKGTKLLVLSSVENSSAVDIVTFTLFELNAMERGKLRPWAG